MTAGRIASQFGDDFARKLTEAPVGRWTGPFASAFGQNLVLVTERRPGTLAPFEQVRAAVEREWYAEHRAAAQGEQFKVLLARYKVVVLPHADTP
jgi:peptidyl-prolyl cis-trans isomerase C